MSEISACIIRSLSSSACNSVFSWHGDLRVCVCVTFSWTLSACSMWRWCVMSEQGNEVPVLCGWSVLNWAQLSRGELLHQMDMQHFPSRANLTMHICISTSVLYAAWNTVTQSGLIKDSTYAVLQMVLKWLTGMAENRKFCGLVSLAVWTICVGRSLNFIFI